MWPILLDIFTNTLMTMGAVMVFVMAPIAYLADRREIRRKKLIEGSRVRELTAWNAGEENQEDA